MIRVTSKGDYLKTRKFIRHLINGDIFKDLGSYGQIGVRALESATPVDTGLTAHSWDYTIIHNDRGTGIAWFNNHVVNGTPLVILLQYGHGTGTGGYVAGKDFINPAIQPIFDEIADDVWKRVKE